MLIKREVLSQNLNARKTAVEKKTEVTGQPERLKQNDWSRVEKPERQLSHVWRQNGEKRG